MQKYLAAMAITFSSSLMAEVIEIPNQFVSGIKALASEVNENLDVIVTESNSQNARITALEMSTLSAINDQMICVTPFNWATGGAAHYCVKQSDPLNSTQPTYVDVAAEGWKATSVGGDGGGRNTFIYSNRV